MEARGAGAEYCLTLPEGLGIVIDVFFRRPAQVG